MNTTTIWYTRFDHTGAPFTAIWLAQVPQANKDAVLSFARRHFPQYVFTAETCHAAAGGR